MFKILDRYFLHFGVIPRNSAGDSFEDRERVQRWAPIVAKIYSDKRREK